MDRDGHNGRSEEPWAHRTPDEPPLRSMPEDGRRVARVVNAAISYHVATFHRPAPPALPRLGTSEWVDLYRN